MIVTVDVIRTNGTSIPPAGIGSPVPGGRVVVWMDRRGEKSHFREWKAMWQWPLR